MDRKRILKAPQNVRSERTRRAILEAAWELLREGGSEATTMKAIAERAGVSRRGLYLHFEARADLLIAVSGFADEKLDLASSLEPVWTAHSGTEALDAFVHHLVAFHPAIMGVLDAVLQARDADPDMAKWWLEGHRRWRTGCLQVTERLADEGVLASCWDAESAADVMVAYMLGFNEMWRAYVEGVGWTPEQFERMLATMFRRTLLRGER